MKPSEILRRAAKRIEDDENAFGCTAINQASKTLRESFEAMDYFIMFKPKSTKNVWFGDAFNQRNQDRRIIALCLAAAIAESEGQ